MWRWVPFALLQFFDIINTWKWNFYYLRGEFNQCLHFGSKYFTNGLRIDSLYRQTNIKFDRVSEKGVNNTDCDAGLWKKNPYLIYWHSYEFKGILTEV